MIQLFKNAIKDSFLFKAFLGLMALAMGVWGVGDFLTPGMDPNIAITVGKSDVSVEAVQRRFNVDMERFKESMGGQAANTEPLKRSVLARTVEQMTRTLTSDVVADEMGVVITTDHVRDAIRQQAAFKDSTGAFSQLQYVQVLNSNNLSEKAFVGMIMSDLRHQTMLQPVAENATAPTQLIDAMTAYRSETRIADTLLVSAADLPLPAQPSDDELKKIYQDNIATFTAPEYRKVSAIVIRAAELVPPESLQEDQLKSYYDENIAKYRDPEKRDVTQIIFETKESAEAAKALMTPGDHLADIARKAKLDAPVDLGELTRDNSLVKMIGTAYDLPVGQVSDVIQTDLGWHLFEVKSATPEKTVPFTSVEEQIRKTVAEDKGTDALYDASTALDDGVAAGTPFDELATRLGGHVVRIEAVDRQGHAPNGLDASGLFDNQHFLETAFATPTGSTSKLMEIPKGYYILTVDGITPPAPRPFADVRKDVVAMWEKQTRTIAAEAAAAKLAASIGPSTQITELTGKDKAVSYAQLGPLTRFGDGLDKAHMVDAKRVSPDLLQRLFAAKPGEVVTASVTNGAVVARLREIIPPANDGDAAKMRGQIADALKEGVANDLLSELDTAFAQRYPARINNKTLDSLVSAAR